MGRVCFVAARTLRFAAAAAVLVAVMMVPLGRAEAAPVYFTPADLEGTRTVADGQLIVEGGHPPGNPDPDLVWPDASISWQITNVPGETLLLYTYTFSGFGPSPAISHITLDLSPDAVNPFDPSAVFDVTLTQNGQTLPFNPAEDLQFGGFDGISTAVKFDDLEPDADLTLVVSFLSNRRPVWGDVFITGGGLDLFNAGFGDRVSTNVNGYIAVPNSVIPTPTAAMGGLALLGVLAARRPRRSVRR